MILRLRNTASKATVKIQVPDTCSLQFLKDILAQTLSRPDSSSLHLSLNRTDELHATSLQDSLQSLGLISGDLVHYSFHESAFSSPNSNSNSNSQAPAPISSTQSQVSVKIPVYSCVGEALESTIRAGDVVVQIPNSKNSEVLKKSQVHESNFLGESSGSGGKLEEGNRIIAFDTKKKSIQESLEAEPMCFDGDSVLSTRNKHSTPFHDMRVPMEALENDRNIQKLLVNAVHFVLMDSGFITLNPDSSSRVDWFNVPDEWPATKSSTLMVRYTLPEILVEEANDFDVSNSAIVKFQSLGSYLNVYASLASSDGYGLHRVCLNERKLAGPIGLIGSNFDVGRYDRNQLLELWIMLKDAIALPLLSDICKKAGLPPPPCFMSLPIELKTKILEALPGVDIARIECVCSELCSLSKNNSLWRQKVLEEVGFVETKQGGITNWKQIYTDFHKNKINGREIAGWRGHSRVERHHHFPVRRDSIPWMPVIRHTNYYRPGGSLIPLFHGQSSRRERFRTAIFSAQP